MHRAARDVDLRRLRRNLPRQRLQRRARPAQLHQRLVVRLGRPVEAQREPAQLDLGCAGQRGDLLQRGDPLAQPGKPLLQAQRGLPGGLGEAQRLAKLQARRGVGDARLSDRAAHAAQAQLAARDMDLRRPRRKLPRQRRQLERGVRRGELALRVPLLAERSADLRRQAPGERLDRVQPGEPAARDRHRGRKVDVGEPRRQLRRLAGRQAQLRLHARHQPAQRAVDLGFDRGARVGAQLRAQRRRRHAGLGDGEAVDLDLGARRRGRHRRSALAFRRFQCRLAGVELQPRPCAVVRRPAFSSRSSSGAAAQVDRRRRITNWCRGANLAARAATGSTPWRYAATGIERRVSCVAAAGGREAHLGAQHREGGDLGVAAQQRPQPRSASHVLGLRAERAGDLDAHAAQLAVRRRQDAQLERLPFDLAAERRGDARLDGGAHRRRIDQPHADRRQGDGGSQQAAEDPCEAPQHGVT